VIVDASIALKWLTREPDSPAALRLLSREDLAAPSILRVEIGNVLTKRAQQGLISAQFAANAWRELRNFSVQLAPIGLELDLAFVLATVLRASFYDCNYLALAVAEGDVLVTADERFVRAVRTSADPQINSRIRTLAEVA
jgi:predicted nucleic acid-binding protein